ncbi:uncharacterized protein NPIL_327271 [Nephila pilipes]|uniref:Uncharacterized protein n=1 Tax=Nephila pilipes TaxID=299642 RepID=A0A8X6NVD4_NEPPI|nr:uncharacterized protein NPIL_327271 [Nephila pilipes]
MTGLFWSAFSFAFSVGNDYLINICTLSGIVHYAMSLLLILFPAAVSNEASIRAHDIVRSLPSYIREHYKELKMSIRRRFKRNTSLTLWKIYIIDKSLLISVLGTLLTYGILFGTLGSVQFSKD